jgi:hypothetical protein
VATVPLLVNVMLVPVRLPFTAMPAFAPVVVRLIAPDEVKPSGLTIISQPVGTLSITAIEAGLLVDELTDTWAFSEINTLPVVFNDKYRAVDCIYAPEDPISPDPETRDNVPRVFTDNPEGSVIVAVPAAVRFTLLSPLRLAFIVIPVPLVAVLVILAVPSANIVALIVRVLACNDRFV